MVRYPLRLRHHPWSCSRRFSRPPSIPNLPKPALQKRHLSRSGIRTFSQCPSRHPRCSSSAIVAFPRSHILRQRRADRRVIDSHIRYLQILLPSRSIAQPSDLREQSLHLYLRLDYESLRRHLECHRRGSRLAFSSHGTIDRRCSLPSSFCYHLDRTVYGRSDSRSDCWTLRWNHRLAGDGSTVLRRADYR